MTPLELATLIEQRRKLRPVSFGRTYREPMLVFEDEADRLIEWLRAMDTTAELLGED